MNEVAWTSAGYLTGEQYRDSSKLALRANLHAYGRGDWFEWAARQIPWPDGGKVLELGCGAGWLWEKGADDIPLGLDLTLSDLSPGMMQEAVARVRGLGRDARGQAADAAALPFEDDTFDLVLAMHMLYHLRDPAAGVREIVRVLKPGGTAVIATNGRETMAELFALKAAVFGGAGRDELIDGFNLECGQPMLEAVFDVVELHVYDDELAITDPQAVFAYHSSSPPGDKASPAQQQALREAIAARFEAGGGVFRVSKSVGAFVCRK